MPPKLQSIFRWCNIATLVAILTFMCTQAVRGEAMLQYFNTDWAEITRKMPEIAEAGYSSLWLPPPTKASGGLSVGYDLWDPFDLGGKNQRSTVRTRYGTEAELLELIRTAHRFGIRVYFDNIMNHRAFDIPGFNENTPIDIYPGMVPEDFHLRTTQEGFYRKWDNTRNWNDAWQVRNLGLADLIDIAQEPGTTNLNFGPSEGSTFPKIKFIRDLERPEQYAYDKDGNYIGFGGLLTLAADLLNDEGNANPTEEQIKARAQQYLQDNAAVYEEYVGDYLNRAVRWLMDRTKADGLRLDAVKHVPADFFGATFGADKDTSDYGYIGQVQRQFNLTRGFSDANHRDTVFDTEKPRDDAMLFGEHLGEPPGYGPYFDAGMRLVDNPLRSEFNGRLGSPWAGLNGFDNPGAGGFAPELTVMHAQSHDSDYAARRELQHAMYFTRAGIGLLYTDGNYQAETLGESGGAFPRHSNTSFLGQWDDPRVPNLLHIHEQFARGYQQGKWSDDDVIIYERVDKRENPGMTDADGVTMLFMLNDNYASGHGRNFDSSFLPGDYLFNYSTYGGGFYKYAWEIEDGSTVIPAGGYFIFSWKNPDPSTLWASGGGRPITIYQSGEEVGTVDVERRDGPNGDADFHGDTLPSETRPIISNPENDDYTYTATVPRVTNGTDLDFIVRVDGSAENVLVRLGGGIDLNGTVPASTNVGLANNDPVNRDNPPALSWDSFLGFEQPTYIDRIHPELFAAAVTGTRDITGSVGAETFTTAGVLNQGSGFRFTDTETASYIYHDPTALVDGESFKQWDGNRLWAKVNSVGAGYRMFVYYTTDDSYFPEGAAGSGVGQTKVAEMNYQAAQSGSGDDWWASAPMPNDFDPATSRYKIGIFKTGAPSWFPGSPGAVERKTRMLTQFAVNNFDATNVEYFPHFDYAKDPEGNFLTTTGLAEGFHIIKARAFLSRAGKASIYNTFKQTFYYDTERPQGEVRFPENNGDTVGGSQYGVVVRTDATVTDVWFNIADGDSSNDDASTGFRNGNGAGFEPFTDTDRDGQRDANEPYEDLNENGQWDDDLAESWVRATEVTPSLAITPSDSSFTREWRFNYTNIPPTGNADIRVRLREVSSAEFKDFSKSDVDAHYTTLVRNVNTAGPNERVFIAFPTSDGEIVGDDYIMKVYFTKSLADGLSEQDLLDRFTIRIGSNEVGDEGLAQDPAEYSIEWNATSEYHALAFDLPNLYNDLPDFIHKITVLYDRPTGQSDFEATRLVKALPVTTPRVLIVNPPELGSDGRPYEILLPDVPSPGPEERQFNIRVATNLDATNVTLSFVDLRGTTVGTPVTSDEGNSTNWDFLWSDLEEGTYRFTATVTSPGGTATASRNARVVFRELVSDGNDDDDDDDGLLNGDENTPQDLPEVNSDQWTNGDIHTYYAYGRSNPLSPDSDGDGLPDGLEVGWRSSQDPPTDPATDTDGDGFPNFIPDLDPPFYNTLDNFGSIPGVNSASEGGDRAKQLEGSVTDPSNPDTDNDGIPDGVEDANRNGWVDGDGELLPTDFNPWLGRNWPDGIIGPGETWTETDPNNRDTDGDGSSDGYGEDQNFNGVVDGDTNGDRLYDAGEAWAETDPLNYDTDGDGLPDGWEIDNGLDPLDNGIDSLRTAEADDGNPAMGADGDPDGDDFTNAQELANSTRPLEDDTLPPPPANSIDIGPGETVTVGAASNGNEFTDWTIDDLLVLDEYDGNGTNNQGGDIYHAYDGFDSSRDLVAFYFRDGGGDGRLYFRADFHDLTALAEEGNLDLYVVIDTGNTVVGESALPDDVDTRTEMKWEAVVAVYQSNNGAVYVDTDSGNNTTVIAEDLFANGIVRRDQNSANGFEFAYFNAELDSVEFSIHRQALIDTGWNGNADNLSFQVYTTRDGTQNNPVGLGDIGGRSDIRDTIYDDWIASDHWRAQSTIGGDGSVLRSWFSRSGANDRGKRAKMALVVHGNQAMLPANRIQDLINDDAGAGYHRLVDAHSAFAEPVNLHITPTLASAIQWAAVDPDSGKPWRDGPSLNARISGLLDNGSMLFGTTFADHILPYVPDAFTASSVALADSVLFDIYETEPSDRVFWPAERVLDDTVLATISNLGFSHTVADQMRHIFLWFGRAGALGEEGYRINRANGIDLFPLHDFASGFRFETHDGGLNFPLRELLSRRARGGSQDQVLTLVSDWEDFSTLSQADAYERNLRWLANRPWIEIVTLEEVATGAVDLSQPSDGLGDVWGTVDRGTNLTLDRTAKDWIDYATQGDYDNWYYGQSGLEQGLAGTTFDIRPGVPLPQVFGEVGSSGIAKDAWNAVSGLDANDGGNLGRMTAQAALFVTAFHNQDGVDLRKFSTGDYLYPDTGFEFLAGFSRNAQGQMRNAALYGRVATWAANPPATATATEEDIDLDGENEYILANDQVFAVFEAIGGRMVAGFGLDSTRGRVYQIVGTQPAYAGTDNETEGDANVENGVVDAHRTSAFKDWFANGSGGGTNAYVNDLYTVASAGSNGWTFTSSDGAISKTISLDDDSARVEATYSLTDSVNKLFVRFGLSPDLEDLIRKGQANLSPLDHDASTGRVALWNTAGYEPVIGAVSYEPSTAQFNSAAIDDGGGLLFDAVNMRNQALTHQVEFENLDGQTTFTLGVSLETGSSDNDDDGLPNWWEDDNTLDQDDDGTIDVNNGPLGDIDGDGMNNRTEFVLGLNPRLEDWYGYPQANVNPENSGGFRITFPVLAGRSYRVWYSDDLINWNPAGSYFSITNNNDFYEWTDDGSLTTPAPESVERRFYRIEVTRP